MQVMGDRFQRDLEDRIRPLLSKAVETPSPPLATISPALTAEEIAAKFYAGGRLLNYEVALYKQWLKLLPRQLQRNWNPPRSMSEPSAIIVKKLVGWSAPRQTGRIAKRWSKFCPNLRRIVHSQPPVQRHGEIQNFRAKRAQNAVSGS